MILAVYSIDIPKYWEHDPTLSNKNGKTVAMILA